MVENVKNKITEMGYEDVIVFDNPDYDTAFIGVTTHNQAVYDYDLMIDYLVDVKGFEFEKATDFISYNDSFYMGNEYPIIINRF